VSEKDGQRKVKDGQIGKKEANIYLTKITSFYSWAVLREKFFYPEINLLGVE
jgi:hypothetical protein